MAFLPSATHVTPVREQFVSLPPILGHSTYSAEGHPSRLAFFFSSCQMSNRDELWPPGNVTVTVPADLKMQKNAAASGSAVGAAVLQVLPQLVPVLESEEAARTPVRTVVPVLPAVRDEVGALAVCVCVCVEQGAGLPCMLWSSFFIL